MDHLDSDDQNIGKILNKLKELENRISQLESGVIQKAPVIKEVNTSIRQENVPVQVHEEEIESRIGEYGMAYLGNFVLFFGIIFLVKYLKSQDFIIFSSILGYFSVAAIYSTGYLLRNSYPHMARLFTYNGHLLLFFVTLGLHFVPSNPLVVSKIPALAFLLAVIISLMYISFRDKKEGLAVIVLAMTLITSIISNSHHFMLALMVPVAGISVFFVYKFGWWRMLFMSIFVVYSTFLAWSFNNPFITKSFHLADNIEYSYVYLLLCSMIYSMLALVPLKEKMSEEYLNASIILNGSGFSIITAILIMTFFRDNYYLLLGIVSALSIAYSALLKSKGVWKLPAAFYALYGFVVLSITIGGMYKFPLAFWLLSIQSLLVISMALWFRSKFIIVMNVIMFSGLLIAYLVYPESRKTVDFSFAIVAFISARIMNWKKDRLEIKTELMRNVYLITGFIMTLVALYRAVPPNYITLSWTMAAGLFFLVSVLLQNIKYRWLAIADIIITVFYFFLFDLRQVDIGFRIIALLFISIISLSFSIFYTRRMRKKTNSPAH